MDFDLEFEDMTPPLSAAVRNRKKLIGLDDLVSEHYKEKVDEVERTNKRGRRGSKHDSDEDECGKEALLSRKIEDCNDQMNEMDTEEELSTWGLCIFYFEAERPQITCDFSSSSMVQCFLDNDINPIIRLDGSQETKVFEGLLVNGWLLKIVTASRNVDGVICKWIFDLMLYSAKAELALAACEFWSTVCSQKRERTIKLEWFPKYKELKQALECYGYAFSIPVADHQNVVMSDGRGPPSNLCHWLRFVGSCFGETKRRATFTCNEIESLVEIVITLSLDRKLQPLASLLRNVMQTLIDYFSKQQWNQSCKNIATNLVSRICSTSIGNWLRVAECITPATIRSSELKSCVSHRILALVVGCEGEEILCRLMAMNLKDRKCDLVKMNVYLCLAEKWVLSDPKVEGNPLIFDKFGHFLRICCSSITSTDLRASASKLRAKACFLLHAYVNV